MAGSSTSGPHRTVLVTEYAIVNKLKKFLLEILLLAEQTVACLGRLKFRW